MLVKKTQPECLLVERKKLSVMEGLTGGEV